jgi:hypothetical protein
MFVLETKSTSHHSEILQGTTRIEFRCRDGALRARTSPRECTLYRSFKCADLDECYELWGGFNRQ